MKNYKMILFPVLCVAAVFLLLRYVLFVGYVPTESMEPTIPKGSYILGSRLYGELQRGDIIIFQKDEKILIKRIAAISGDYIQRDGTYLFVPEGSYYVVGDNQINSSDSRIWKNPFIGKEEIIAKFAWVDS